MTQKQFLSTTILTNSLLPPKKVLATLSSSTSARVLTRSMMGIILAGCLLYLIAWYIASCPPTVLDIKTVSIIITSSLSSWRTITCSMIILVAVSPKTDKDLAKLEMAACRRNIGGQTVFTRDILRKGGRRTKEGWEQLLVRMWRRSSVLLMGGRWEGGNGGWRRGDSSGRRLG